MKNKIGNSVLLTMMVFLVSAKIAVACAPDFPNHIYEKEDILDNYYPPTYLYEDIRLKKENDESLTKEDLDVKNRFEIITPGLGPEHIIQYYALASGNNLPENIVQTLLYDYGSAEIVGWGDYYREGLNETEKQWLEIKNKYTDTPSETVSCNDQVIKRAIEDYEYRKEKFTESQMKTWIAQQDNCIDSPYFESYDVPKKINWWQKIITWIKNIDKKTISISSTPAEQLLKYDIEYKNATKKYYSSDYDTASKEFRQILSNKNHPHRTLAALSLGWTYLKTDRASYEEELKDRTEIKDSVEREANNIKAEENYVKNLKETQKYYEEIVSDRDFESVKHDAQKYLDFILFRTDPARRAVEASIALMTSNDSDEFTRQLIDFTRIWYRYIANYSYYEIPENEIKNFNNKIIESDEPFVKFLLGWKTPKNIDIKYSIDNYNKSNNKLWLILALRQTHKDEDNYSFIKNEINKIKEDSPFYITAQYYLAEQLVKDDNSKEEVKVMLEKMISSTYDNGELTALNLFSNLRENISDTPEESLEYSLRYSIGDYSFWWDTRGNVPYYSYRHISVETEKKHPVLSNKAITELSRLNTSELSKLIINNTGWMEKTLRRYLEMTVFNRAFALGDFKSADLLAIDIQKHYPELSSTFNKYLFAKNNTDKRFEAAKILINYPLIYPHVSTNIEDFSSYSLGSLQSIDSYRRNWTSFDECQDEKYKRDTYSETDQMIEDKNTINSLMKSITDYMTSNPSYFNPKILHQVVDVGHYAACTDKETSDLARQAFQLLHIRYPNSYWAKQTPYWY